MKESIGRKEPTRLERAVNRLRFGIRRALVKYVRVAHGDDNYVFHCEAELDVYRAVTLFVKEEGTVAWIEREVHPGDVFYDIGANIGVYSLVAGTKVGSGGHVYAFEPHLVNAATLLRNVRLTGLNKNVSVLCTALHSENCLVDFNYYSLESGSSTSQLGGSRDDQEKAFTPVYNELKAAVTIDSLISDSGLRPPDVVKIDVDGNELPILQGMGAVLSGPRPPRCVQVEMNSRHKQSLLSFMSEVGFDGAERHFSLACLRRIAKGEDPESLPYYLLFRPRARFKIQPQRQIGL